MNFNQTTHEINGVETAVLTAGSGDPVVFLHGAGTLTGFDWLLPIAENNRLIVANHPGFGASGGPPCTTVTDLVRHHLDVLDQLDVDSFVLVGQSMGGGTAAVMASFLGSRVTKLVLAAPAGLVSAEHPMVDLRAVPDDEVLQWLTEDMSIFEGHIPAPPPPEFFADRVREANSFGAIAEHLVAPGLDQWLHRLTMSTTLLWGDTDRLIPVGQAAEWAALLPNATVITYEGAGHLLFEERPDSVTAIVDLLSA